MTKPTPFALPWRAQREPLYVVDCNDQYVADVKLDESDPWALATVEFIVRACNSHAELLEALRDIGTAPCIRALLGESDDSPCWCPSCRAKAAIAKAEGEK